jgi:hypothetical protein
MEADRGRCRFWGGRGVARWSCEYIEVAKRVAKYIPEGTMTPVQRGVEIATRVGRSIYARVVIRKEMLLALAERGKSAVSLPWGDGGLSRSLDALHKAGSALRAACAFARPQCGEGSVQKMAEMLNGYCTQ